MPQPRNPLHDRSGLSSIKARSTAPDETLRNSWSFSEKLIAWTVISVLIIVFCLVQRSSSWLFEDAMITMRYARNIAQGEGYVYNPGGHDFATSSVTWTLICAGSFAVAGDDECSLYLIKSLESVLCACCMILTGLLGQRLRLSGFATIFLVAAMFFSNGVFLFMSAGMELPLFLLLILLSISSYLYRSYGLTGVTLGLLFLTRPEGILTAAVLGVVRIIEAFGAKEGFSRLAAAGGKSAGAFILVVAPWLLFASYYFGRIVPDSGEVKLLTATNWGYYISGLTDKLVDSRVWAIPFFIGICWTLLKEDREWLIILFHFVLYNLFFVLMLFPKCPWYYIPNDFAFFALAALGLDIIFRSVKLNRPYWATALGSFVLFLLIVVPDQSGLQLRVTRLTKELESLTLKNELVEKRVANWLNENSPVNTVIGMPNIGVVGFYLKRPVVDLVGLVHPDIARNPSQEYWIRKYKPDYVVDKYKYRHRLLHHPCYKLVQTIGPARYGGERWVVFLNICPYGHRSDGINQRHVP